MDTSKRGTTWFAATRVLEGEKPSENILKHFLTHKNLCGRLQILSHKMLIVQNSFSFGICARVFADSLGLLQVRGGENISNFCRNTKYFLRLNTKY